MGHILTPLHWSLVLQKHVDVVRVDCNRVIAINVMNTLTHLLAKHQTLIFIYSVISIQPGDQCIFLAKGSNQQTYSIVLRKNPQYACYLMSSF